MVQLGDSLLLFIWTSIPILLRASRFRGFWLDCHESWIKLILLWSKVAYQQRLWHSESPPFKWNRQQTMTSYGIQGCKEPAHYKMLCLDQEMDSSEEASGTFSTIQNLFDHFLTFFIIQKIKSKVSVQLQMCFFQKNFRTAKAMARQLPGGIIHHNKH